jgi:MOSC domain-containing protein YiiM
MVIVMETLAERLAVLPQVGRVEWIGLSPHPRGELQAVSHAVLLVDHGLEGDHHAKHKAGSKRQVTFMQAEHLPAIASMVHMTDISPGLLRRNVVIAGINLLALKGRRFRIGDCELAGTGPCDPCSRMEENLGPGGLNAMRGHGGLTAKVLAGGTIKIGDEVRALGSVEETR